MFICYVGQLVLLLFGFNFKMDLQSEKGDDVKEYVLKPESELRFEIESKTEKVKLEVNIFCLIFTA